MCPFRSALVQIFAASPSLIRFSKKISTPSGDEVLRDAHFSGSKAASARGVLARPFVIVGQGPRGTALAVLGAPGGRRRFIRLII